MPSRPRKTLLQFELRVSRRNKVLRVVHRKTNRTVQIFKVATGTASTPTPRGTFRVDHVNHEPFFRRKDKSIIPPGPGNPLHPVLIVLQRHGKRIPQSIHGTKATASIGTAASAGCIRLNRADAGLLASLVKPNMRVKIR
ncbi:MAG: L,D-transpeptidase [archaeon]|nr:L,D-transpeptidase [archaeon]